MADVIFGIYGFDFAALATVVDADLVPLHSFPDPSAKRETALAAILGGRKSGGAEGSWAGEFLRMSRCAVEPEPVHCGDAPIKDVNL